VLPSQEDDMATNEMREVIHHLRRTVFLQEGAGLTDGQLLEDFINRRNATALAALVQRHGPMVWGVCRRVLRNDHDAEDAFQAAFLVFVRKAGSIVPRQMVANWLYGVAHQTALNARTAASRRKGRERQVAEMPESAVAEQDLWHDLKPILDEELSRLPDKYRSVVVLCDLEGKTRKEAARQIGVPDGTIAGWLARARVMLAKRLTQRGVALSGGALAAVLAQQAASAGVPTSVVSATIKTAGLFATAKAAGTISAKVAALAEGVMKAMLLTKLKTIVAVTAALVVTVGIGAGLLAYGTAACPKNEGEKPDAVVLQKGEVGAQKAQSESDRDRIQGTWVMESQEFAGKAAARKDMRPQWWYFKDDKLTILSIDLRFSEPEKSVCTFSLAEGMKPKVIEMTGGRRLEGPRTKPIDNWKAIYKIEGAYLTIAVGKMKLPQEFKTTDGDGVVLVVLKREGGTQKPVGDQRNDGKDKKDKPDGARREVRHKQGEIAWGEATEGLQAGIAFRNGEPDHYLPGQTVNLEIFLRNTAQEKITVSHIETLFEEWLPGIVDTNRKTCKVVNGPLNLGQASIVTRTLHKGEAIRLGTAWFVIQSPGIKGEATASALVAPPGKYLVRLSGFPLRRPGHDFDEQKWSTGQVELQVGALK
jgi:RNA polymerase sigma factor (sigma-70 family)